MTTRVSGPVPLPSEWPPSEERLEVERIIRGAPGPRLVKVREGVFAAVGYSCSHMGLVDTGDGLVVIDATESAERARAILADFRKISKAPVKALIYTHSHFDHLPGAKAFVGKDTRVFAHEDFLAEFTANAALGKSGRTRGAAMFGAAIPDSERIPPNVTDYPSPVATRFVFEPVGPQDIVQPTETYSKSASFEVGGVTFNLIHTPGETRDHTIVHIPELKTVACGDNFYPTFPNLYTLRGCGPRPILEWARAQDMVIGLEPDHLLSGHGLPLQGAKEIREVLSNYRDAIRYVHDFALEAVQNFEPVDEAARRAALPPHLARLPYLRQSYGYVPYCVKAIYEGRVGWFDGNPVNLNPLSRGELGAEVIALAGSVENVLARAEQAQREGRHQVVLELCEMVLAREPVREAARLLRIGSLIALSKQSANGPTANYYRSFAEMGNQDLAMR